MLHTLFVIPVIMLSLTLTCAIEARADNAPEKTVTDTVKEPSAETIKESSAETIKEPLFKPFIERYILDELKMLRQDQQNLRAEVIDRVAQSKLEATDRSVRYTTDTLNNVFFIITAAASIVVIVGWNSLRDIKSRLDEIVNSRVAHITEEYESRLQELESRLRTRSEQIINAQEEITRTNEVHSLWMRAGLEASHKSKIEVYDQILNINPNDLEAITYKADVVLETGDSEWALNLSNKAVELDPDYGHAYWQRACAKAELGLEKEALKDIQIALDKSPSLGTELANESAFRKLRRVDEYIELVEQYKNT